MQNKIYIGNNLLNSLDENTIIYKFIKLEYLESILKNNTLRIDKINSWEDVYENFFFKQRFLRNKEKVNTADLTEKYFGMSWTSEEESDAMWRIYSQDRNSIRIKTTVSKLMSMICSCEKDTAYCYMGNVDYKTENDINEWIKNVNNLSIRDFWAIAKESFFIKRDNFSHEKEIRLIYALDSDSKVKNYLTFEINQNILFDEFCIDPRCSDSEFNIIKNKLMQNGVVKNKIIKSKLYEFTPLILNFS